VSELRVESQRLLVVRERQRSVLLFESEPLAGQAAPVEVFEEQLWEQVVQKRQE
jgi:hypothetical protein